MSDLLYCILSELIHDLDLPGIAATKETRLLDRIRAASDWLTMRAGRFVPFTETRRYDGPGGKTLFVDPLLAVTTLTDDTTTLTLSDYLLYPRNRHWVNGPYTWIEIDPDASSLTAWTHEQDIIAIAGRHGKYEESITTGTTVANTTKIAAADTALKAANGAAISPGMVLLIESEQLLVTATGVLTTATSLLAAVMDVDDTSVAVDNGAEFNVGEVIRVGSEDMRIEVIATNTLTLTRKWNETDAAAHANDAAISVYRTYTVKRGCNGTIAADHTNGTAISRYIAPWDINWLTRQIAGLMQQKAKAGFAGKSGSAELGEVFFHQEFPKDVVQAVVRKYAIASI